MAYDIPTDIPTLFTAGDTLKFTKELADYLPADGWTLTYSLVNSSAQIQFSASDNGDGTHLVNVATTTTDDWTAGDYRWQATVTDGSDRHTVDRGTITIRTNYSAATAGFDGRGTWQTILDNLESAYSTLAAGDVTSVTVSFGDKQVVYRDLADLIAAINHARVQAAQEKRADKLADGLNTGAKILTRFI